MGSLAKGLITGYVCRLCSKMNSNVILIYSDNGEKMGLAYKINKYLPVTVERSDRLPKTICMECLRNLEGYSKTMEKLNASKIFSSSLF